MTGPRVSVVIPAYNAEPFIGATIESILRQTFSDFEVLVVDDASTDATTQIVESIPDPRIRLMRRQVNGGIARAVNTGYTNAHGELIAQMDHDDLAWPTRLERQAAFLDANPGIHGCGGAHVRLGRFAWLDRLAHLKKRRANIVPPDVVACETLFTGIIFNPTIMFRRTILDRLDLAYDPEFKIAADKDFLERSMAAGVRWAVIPDLVLRYRRHRTSASHSNQGRKTAEKTVIAARAVLRLVPDATQEEMAVHIAVANRDPGLGPGSALAVQAWFGRLLAANRIRNRFDPEAMRVVLARNWLRACALAAGCNPWRGLALYLSRPELGRPRGLGAFLYEWQKRAVNRLMKAKKRPE
jgi:glycosyltransferase involved in cell wall biosynthesis